MFATGVIMGLAEWIINDNCLVFCALTTSNKFFHKNVFIQLSKPSLVSWVPCVLMNSQIFFLIHSADPQSQ